MTHQVHERALRQLRRAPIVLSYQRRRRPDVEPRRWRSPGSHPSCTFQSTGPPASATRTRTRSRRSPPDGTVYVHFGNYQNEAAWEVPFDFDSQIMVVTSHDGGVTFGDPVPGRPARGRRVRHAVLGHRPADGLGPPDPLELGRQHRRRSDRSRARDGRSGRTAGRRTPNATAGVRRRRPRSRPTYDPCNAGPGVDLDVYRADSFDGGATWGPRTLVDDAGGASQWFPWAGYRPDGSLVVAWDEDTAPAPPTRSSTCCGTAAAASRRSRRRPSRSTSRVTHWAGQYVPQAAWPTICGPAGYTDPPVTDAEGKDCNVFHGDYTGLDVGAGRQRARGVDRPEPARRRRRRSTSTPARSHDGYAQDAMYSRR